MTEVLGRRSLLRKVRPDGRARLPHRRRPPGAASELEFLSGCTACGKCVEACPYNAVHTLADHVRPGGGTPVMVPESRPCHRCTDFPCVRACPEPALDLQRAPHMDLGTVWIDPDRCFTFRGPECGACAGLCPTDRQAIVMHRNQPLLYEEDCIGCGLCIEACPTTPKAIAMEPLG